MNRSTMGVNSLPKTVTRQRRDCDLNPGPSAPESSTLTTRLPSHRRATSYNYIGVGNGRHVQFPKQTARPGGRGPSDLAASFEMSASALGGRHHRIRRVAFSLAPLPLRCTINCIVVQKAGPLRNVQITSTDIGQYQ